MVRSFVASILLLSLAAGVHSEPDEAALGKDHGYPVGTISNWISPPYRVGSWSALDRVAGIRVSKVAAASEVRPLAETAWHFARRAGA